MVATSYREPELCSVLTIRVDWGSQDGKEDVGCNSTMLGVGTEVDWDCVTSFSSILDCIVVSSNSTGENCWKIGSSCVSSEVFITLSGGAVGEGSMSES